MPLGHGGLDFDSGGTSSSSYTDEQAQDAVGGALRSTTSIAATYTDASDRITFDVVGVDASAVANFSETAQDAVGGILRSTSTVVATYDDAANTITFAALTAGSADTIVNPKVTVLTATTTSVFTVTVGTQRIIVEVVAGGGGGGGIAGSATQAGGAGGGASGGYSLKYITNTATAYTYRVGPKGAGATAGNNNGSDGADSVFATVLTKGGGGGLTMATGTSVLGIRGGREGGISTGGDVNCGGNPGQSGFRFSATTNLGGAGGSGPWGGGGNPASGNGDGEAADGPGSGGSGGLVASQNTARTGGDGADGIIIVREYVRE